MAKYSIWIVSPPNYPHSRAFEEIALSLNYALQELGHQSKIVTSSYDTHGITIVLGAHLLPHAAHYLRDLPDNLIFYNLEQITPGSPWLSSDYIRLLRGSYAQANIRSRGNLQVWDYSQANIAELKKHRINASLCGVGYAPPLTRIENVIDPDIDVLFVGSMNQRRSVIITALSLLGFKVFHAYNSYGIARDALIARAKIVLNLHFYESKVFEIVRCSYLLANRKCVVSEVGMDSELEETFVGALEFCGYGDIVNACTALINNPERRAELAQRGFEIFSAQKQSALLAPLLTHEEKIA